MRNLKDTIYEDDDFVIIRKGVDENGHFEPSTLLGLISIATQGLEKWHNFGLLYKEDAEEIIDKITSDLKACLHE